MLAAALANIGNTTSDDNDKELMIRSLRNLRPSDINTRVKSERAQLALEQYRRDELLQVTKGSCTFDWETLTSSRTSRNLFETVFIAWNVGFSVEA
jgi:hypothetical protein